MFTPSKLTLRNYSLIMAGASLVGVGSAVYLRGYKIYQEIIDGLKDFIRKENIKNIKSLIGVAHQ